MGLAQYRRNRDFRRTPEPRGANAAKRRRRFTFVVHKHEATHLHYDFRLEWGGVLKSWAIPKGPSNLPAQKRLAVQVEDHPIEYNQFEGVIPEGEYGAGTVMIWDCGTWVPAVADVDRALAKGDLKFTLYGKKLRGSWVLVRMRGRQWLLIKHRDKVASTEDITAAKPRSAVSRRTLAGIARRAGASARQLAQAEEADNKILINARSKSTQKS